MTKGYIHSFQSMGTLDGLEYVFWFLCKDVRFAADTVIILTLGIGRTIPIMKPLSKYSTEY